MLAPTLPPCASSTGTAAATGTSSPTMTTSTGSMTGSTSATGTMSTTAGGNAASMETGSKSILCRDYGNRAGISTTYAIKALSCQLQRPSAWDHYLRQLYYPHRELTNTQLPQPLPPPA